MTKILSFSEFLNNKHLVLESVYSMKNIDTIDIDRGEDKLYIDMLLDKLAQFKVSGNEVVITEDNVDYEGNIEYYKPLLDQMAAGELDDDQKFLDTLKGEYRFGEYLSAANHFSSYRELLNFLKEQGYKYLVNDIEVRLIEIYQHGNQEQQDDVFNIMMINKLRQMFRELNKWYAYKTADMDSYMRADFITDKVSDFILGVGAQEGSEGYFRKTIRCFDPSTGGNYNSYFSRLLHGFATKYVKSVETDISIDAPVGNGDGEDKDMTLQDKLESEPDETEPIYDTEDKKRLFQKLLDGLTDQEKSIITRRYLDDQNLAVIADEMNTSTQNVSRIIKIVLKKLQNSPVVKDLREYMYN